MVDFDVFIPKKVWVINALCKSQSSWNNKQTTSTLLEVRCDHDQMSNVIHSVYDTLTYMIIELSKRSKVIVRPSTHVF